MRALTIAAAIAALPAVVPAQEGAQDQFRWHTDFAVARADAAAAGKPLLLLFRCER